MASQKLFIGVSIGKDDQDIAAWFNLLKIYKVSVSYWISAMMDAYMNQESIDIGTVSYLNEKQSVNIMFGSGNAQKTTQKKLRGWTVKGEHGEYIEGSIIGVYVYKKDTITAFLNLKQMGFAYASVVKMLIRRYLQVGREPRLPNSGFIKNESLDRQFDAVDRSLLLKPIERKKTERASVLSGKPTSSHTELPSLMPEKKESVLVPEHKEPAQPVLVQSEDVQMQEHEPPKKKKKRNPLLDMIS